MNVLLCSETSVCLWIAQRYVAEDSNVVSISPIISHYDLRRRVVPLLNASGNDTKGKEVSWELGKEVSWELRSGRLLHSNSTSAREHNSTVTVELHKEMLNIFKSNAVWVMSTFFTREISYFPCPDDDYFAGSNSLMT
jgi:hypothetical protein